MTASLFIHTVLVVFRLFSLYTGAIIFGRPAPSARTLGAVPHVGTVARGSC